MDAQVAHRLQAEEQAKEQYQSFQTARQVDIDCTNHPALAPYRQNRQNPILGQVRSN